MPRALLATFSAAALVCVARCPASADTTSSQLPCARGLAATRIAGEANAIRVIFTGPATPPAGTLTAYGENAAWSGAVAEARATDASGREMVIVLRTPAPVDALTLARPQDGCRFHARVGPVLPRFPTPRPDVPTLTVTNEERVAALPCSQPYVPAKVVHAVSAETPGLAVARGLQGTVDVIVTLDEHGTVAAVRVGRSDGVLFNPSALEAARRTTYAPEIFRCAPVAGEYAFLVDFSPR